MPAPCVQTGPCLLAAFPFQVVFADRLPGRQRERWERLNTRPGTRIAKSGTLNHFPSLITAFD